jgi:D-sedoheptulose 7-phosphate isomerase
MDCTKNIRDYIAADKKMLDSLDVNIINDVLNELLAAHERRGRIYIFGNGGSASTASHFVNDFNKGVSEYVENKFRFNCLNDNTATVLAVANDIGYDEIFRFQLRGRLDRGDLVIGISGSGNSPNVVNAIEYAKAEGARTIAVTGYDGGKAARVADVAFVVPVDNMQIVEDGHMILDHLLMTVVYEIWNIPKH